MALEGWPPPISTGVSGQLFGRPVGIAAHPIRGDTGVCHRDADPSSVVDTLEAGKPKKPGKHQRFLLGTEHV